MDGLTLLLKLKELKNPSLKTVVVSAYGDMDNIRTAMNRGAFDFLTKPINFEDLEITIDKTLGEILQIRKGLEEHDQLISIQHDLQTAREIQQAILPKCFPPFPDRKDFDIYAAMIAAREVGGDFYDFFMIDNDRIGFVIGDVAGKGVPAAIFMAVSRTIIRATGLKGIAADDCMNYVNNLLCSESVASMYVTVFYGILNTANGELDYVNAGHNPPLHIRNAKISKLKKGGMILGVMPTMVPYISEIVQLEPEDAIILFTDGITEAMNKKWEEYSDERLETLVLEKYHESSQSILSNIKNSVEHYTDGAEQSDDITCLVIKVK